MNKNIASLTISCFISLGLNSMAQTVKPDISNEKKLTAVNREMTIAHQAGKSTVHLNSKPLNGVAWINNANFEKGIIEFDVKGKNVQQQSFVGIAFHGLNDSTFDVIYFRPFNFQSTEAIRKSHSVQYISLPGFDWFVLREKYPNKYESRLVSEVDPESWFHAKVVVETGKISVYVNDDKEPSLVVQPITDRTAGKIGFWVGNGSDGDFANLSIQNQ